MNRVAGFVVMAALLTAGCATAQSGRGGYGTSQLTAPMTHARTQPAAPMVQAVPGAQSPAAATATRAIPANRQPAIAPAAPAAGEQMGRPPQPSQCPTQPGSGLPCFVQ